MQIETNYLINKLVFRQILVLCLATGRSCKITDANTNMKKEHLLYIKFIKLISPLSKFVFDENENSLLFVPNTLVGGNISFDCGDYSIGYFLEYSLILFLLFKFESKLVITGITNDNNNPSVDYIKHVLIKNVANFAKKKNEKPLHLLDLKINKRSGSFIGDGNITLTCIPLREHTPIALTDLGKIKRIRGYFHSIKTSTQNSSIIVNKTREILNQYINDIYIYSDVINNSKDASKEPGYGLLLCAESTTGVIKGVELYANKGDSAQDLAEKVTHNFLMEINKTACLDSLSEGPMVLFSFLGSKNIFKISTQSPNLITAMNLKLIYEMFGAKCLFDTNKQTECIITGAGLGITNFSKKVI